MSLATGSGASVEALETFAAVLSRAGEGMDGDAFYGHLCEAICELTTMRRAVIFRYDDARRHVRAAGAHGLELGLFAQAHVTVESAPIAQRALAEDRVVEVEGDLERELPAEYVGLLHGNRLTCAPMAAAGRWVGVILAEGASGAPPLLDAERHVLWTLGKTAALTALARIATTQGERARALEHRIDLARDIHDQAIQRLFGTSLALSGEGDLPSDVRERCRDEVQSSLAELRASLQRPLGRTPAPTLTTLAEHVERLAAEHPDLGVVLESGDPNSVPTGLQAVAQSVLTEAVRNAHRHATPTRVAVRIAEADGAFVLEVANDGVRGRGLRSGMGLRLVAFEALQHGGFVEFGQREPGSWQVRLVVPRDVG